MKRSKLTEWDVDEDLYTDIDVLSVYEKQEVDQILNKLPVLLDSYYMVKDLQGEDSKLAKEALEELFEYIEEMRE